MRPLRAMLSALAMYTWLPVTKHDWQDRDFPDGLVALSWVGALLGVFVGFLGWGIAWAADSRFLGAALALAITAWLTGAMHLDGLADVADGLGSRKPAEQARAIMKQSDIGPMGVVSLVSVLLIELGAITAIPAATWPLILALGMIAGRVTPLAGAVTRPGAAPVPGSLSALVNGKIQPYQLWLARAVVLLAAGAVSWALLGWRGLLSCTAAILIAWLLAALWQRHLLRRLGRLNGDCFGSLIELTQASVWLVLAVVWKGIGLG